MNQQPPQSSNLLSHIVAFAMIIGLVLVAGFVAVVVWDCFTYLPIVRRWYRTLPTNAYGQFIGLLIIGSTAPFWFGHHWLGCLTILLLLLVLRYETKQYIRYLATQIVARQREIDEHGTAQRGGPEAQPDVG